MLPLLQPDDTLMWVRWRWLWQLTNAFRRVTGPPSSETAPAPPVPASHESPMEWLQGRVVLAVLSPTMTVCKRVGPVGHVPPDVGPGSVWLLGDNPPQSHDSRHHGAAPLAAVDGVVLGIVWPPHRWQLVA